MPEVWFPALMGLTGAVVACVLTAWAMGRGAARRSREAARQAAEMAERLREASERSAAAEVRAARIPEIENSLAERDDRIERMTDEATALKETIRELETTLDKERLATDEKLALLDQARQKMSDTFQALSAGALKSNREAFMALAEQTFQKHRESATGDLEKRRQAISEMVKPIGDALKSVDRQIQAVEKDRAGSFAALNQHIEDLAKSQARLQRETQSLVTALRAPKTRGNWGEMILRRVVEMAGMSDHCDYSEQPSVATDAGRLQPDLVIHMPGGRNVVVDAKAPLQAYLDAREADDETERARHLAAYADHVAAHVRALGSKAYWQHIESTPEFVVLFLPGENFFSAALERRSALIEESWKQRVIVASPTTLLALLRAVAYGWRQERIAENTRKIADLGREFCDRADTLTKHLGTMGARLDSAVEAYNKLLRSFDSRLLVTARKFQELGAGRDRETPPAPEPIERRPAARSLTDET